jgi:hypothetical protein
MKHLFEFDSFGTENIKESSIPVYNDALFNKDPKAAKVDSIQTVNVPAMVKELLDKVKAGELEKVTVVADIPMQGKNAPAYVKELVDEERKRIAKRKYAIYGSRIEAQDRPEEERHKGEVNIFIDSEHLATGVENINGQEYILGVPNSFIRKVEANPELAGKYTVKISPKQVLELSFDPAK